MTDWEDFLEALPTRVRNCIRNDNISSFEELCRCSEAEMLRTPNFGRRSLFDLKAALGALNWSLTSVAAVPTPTPQDKHESLDARIAKLERRPRMTHIVHDSSNAVHNLALLVGSLQDRVRKLEMRND